jgi:uncharacterized protein YukE
MTQSDYDDAARRGAIIEKLAEDLKLLAEDLDGLALEIKPHWRGQAADAYIGQCGKLCGSMAATAADMAYAGQTIKQVAAAAKALSDAAV